MIFPTVDACDLIYLLALSRLEAKTLLPGPWQSPGAETSSSIVRISTPGGHAGRDRGRHAVGRIVSNFFIALDGVVEQPDQWHMSFFNDEMGAIIGAGMETNKAFLMGRKGYEEWAAYWPSSTDEPFASYFNDIEKYVISSSLQEATWKNTTLLRGDVDEVREVKQRVDGDIGMSGSATTVRWLLANGLLDELRLLLHPVAVGTGHKLFEDSSAHGFELVDSSTLSTGVLYLAYRPTR